MKRVLCGAALFLCCTWAGAETLSLQRRVYKVGPTPCAIAVRDLNDDGLPDIVTADRGEMRGPLEEKPANDELSLLIAQEDGSYIRRTPSLRTGFAPYDVALVNVDALRWPDIVTVSFHTAQSPNLHLFLNLHAEDLFKPIPFSLPDEDLRYKFRLPDEMLDYLRHDDGDGQPVFSKPGLTSLAVADLNGDGLRDVVATGWASDVVAVIPGHAEKYFDIDAIQYVPVAGAPRDVVLADLNGDGHRDAAVALYGTGEVALLLGDGTGALSEDRRFSARGRLPVCILHQDMNGDGRGDLVVAHRDADDSVVMFFGTADGQFDSSQVVSLGEDPLLLECDIRGLAASDFDGDGRCDLAAACHASGKVVLLGNRGEPGSFRLRFAREDYGFDAGKPAALAAADLNGDGAQDLAVALWQEDAVALLLNKGK